MKNFEILELETLVYQRYVTVKRIGTDTILKLYFVELDEDANDYGGESIKRKVGDILEGRLYINSVSKIKKVEGEIKYEQPNKYDSINAIVEITKIIDEYSFYALSSLQEEEILVEVEDIISFKKGDKVYIEGFLEIEPKEYLEDELE